MPSEVAYFTVTSAPGFALSDTSYVADPASSATDERPVTLNVAASFSVIVTDTSPVTEP